MTESAQHRPDAEGEALHPSSAPERAAAEVAALASGRENSAAARVRELAALYRLAEQLQAAQSFEELYEAALDSIVDALRCQRASILLFDNAGVMRFVAWRGLSDGYRTAVDGHSPWTPDVRDPAPICVTDILTSSEPDALKATIAAEGIRGLAFIPLVSGRRLVGKFMCYYPAPHVFTDDEVNLAHTIGRQLGLAVARRKAEDELRNSEERFRLMAEHAPVMIWVSDAQGRCLHLNRMLRTFWGVDEAAMASFDWGSTIHPEDAANVASQIGEALAGRRSVTITGRYRDAKGRYRVLQTSATPRFSHDGDFAGMIGVNVDITERAEAEEQRELLLSELNHRVKNTLAVVQGIARQTFKQDMISSVALAAFEDRLQALGQAQNLLTQSNWQSALLDQLADLVIKTSGVTRERVSVSGPTILLPPKEALAIALALHELCTNARKYGALSNPSGRIALDWTASEAPQPILRLAWRESGGPPVSQPEHRGFGTLLLRRALAHDLNGEVDLSFEPSGLICRIEAPLMKAPGGFM
jgi:PAS domain S-box-containing protein